MNFKPLRKLGLALAVAVAAGFTTACNDDETTSVPENNILEIVASSSDFDILEAAVGKAELGATLSSEVLTVFAPTDAAFVAYFGAASEGEVINTINNDLSVEDVTNLLLYHVVRSSVLSVDITTSSAALRSLRNTSAGQITGRLFVSKTSSGLRVNNRNVVSADIQALNGAVHVIDGVLAEPTTSIVDIAVAGADFDVLEAAVVRAGLAATLSSAGPFTVFAPTDAAFISFLGAADEADAINTVNGLAPTALAGILQGHVVAGAVFSSDLPANGVVQSLNTQSPLTLTAGSTGVTVRGFGATASNVVTTGNGTTFNVLATNGVIHVIDRVIQTSPAI